MAAPKRSKTEREQALVRVAELHVKGKTQSQIAAALSEELGAEVTQQQISYDLAQLRKRWQKESGRTLGEETAKLDAVEAAAWTQWGETRRVSFLYVALACIRERTKLLGLAPEEADQSVQVNVALVWQGGEQTVEAVGLPSSSLAIDATIHDAAASSGSVGGSDTPGEV